MKKGTIVFRSEDGDPVVCFEHVFHGRIHVRLYREWAYERLPLGQSHLARPDRFRWMVSSVRECRCADQKPMTLRELAEWPVKDNIWGGGVEMPSKTEFSHEAAAVFAATPDAPGRLYQEHSCKTRVGSGSICLGTYNAYLGYEIDHSTGSPVMEVFVSVAPCDETCAIVPFRLNRRLRQAIAQHIHEFGIRRPRTAKAA